VGARPDRGADVNDGDRSTSSVGSRGCASQPVLFVALEVRFHRAVPVRLRTARLGADRGVRAWRGAPLRSESSRPGRRRSSAQSLAFDTAVISGFALIFSYECRPTSGPSSSRSWAALRFGLRGGVIVPLLRCRRSRSSSGGARTASGPQGSAGTGDLPVRDLAADGLDRRLAHCPAPTGGGGRKARSRPSNPRPAQAARVWAAGRCARALGSSLDIGRIPAHSSASSRARAVRPDGDRPRRRRRGARDGDRRRRRPTCSRPAAIGRSQDRSWNSAARRGRSTARTCAKRAKGRAARAARPALRVVAPLLAGARAIRMISVVARAPLVHARRSAALAPRSLRRDRGPNIRAYDGAHDRRGLRRLSALRADFVRSSRTSCAARWRR
jgi:hypothetical protein